MEPLRIIKKIKQTDLKELFPYIGQKLEIIVLPIGNEDIAGAERTKFFEILERCQDMSNRGSEMIFMNDNTFLMLLTTENSMLCAFDFLTLDFRGNHVKKTIHISHHPDYTHLCICRECGSD